MKKTIKKEKSNSLILYKNILAVIFLTLSIALFTSFISYFFHWKEDQNTNEDFFNTLVKPKNSLGKIGNIVAEFFINDGVGFVALCLPIIFLFVGVKILTNLKIYPIAKLIKYALFITLWFPLSLNFLFGNNGVLSGIYGKITNEYLKLFIGNVGLGLFLLSTILIFLIISLKLDLTKLLSFLNFQKNKEDENDLINEENIIKKNEPSEQSDNHKSSFVIEKNDELPKNLESNIDFNSEIIEIEKENEIDEIGLTVETTKEENLIDDKAINKILEKSGEYDPYLDLPNYQFPKLSLLKSYDVEPKTIDKNELEENKDRIVETLGNYSIKIDKIKATIGPTVTLYEIVPEAGVRISKIKNLEDDIALSLSALGIRIIAPIPGKGTIGIEVPNRHPSIVSMRSVISSEKFQTSKLELPIAIGKTISNETYVFDLVKMPHLLMAGATGQGKSVGLNAIITSLLYKKHPSELKFVFVDPKKVELTLYNKIERHFLAKLPDSQEAIITENDKVINTLNSLCIEMDERYDLLKNAYVRNIKEYNQKFKKRKLNPDKGHRYLPYIVLVVDEFADLIMTAGKEVELPIARLAQLARAIGIHLIIATQRPSVNVITGMIKANFPARIGFRVTSKIDSRTILDSSGADQLIGKGDLLFNTGNHSVRIQCAFIDTPEVDELTEFISSQRAYPNAFLLPEYVNENDSSSSNFNANDRDELFEDAARIVVATQQGSTSMLQRKLKLGYNRAGRIVDQLEGFGILGPFEGSKARQVLIQDESGLEQLLNSIK